jgi:hypothetical protein
MESRLATGCGRLIIADKDRVELSVERCKTWRLALHGSEGCET